MFEFSNKVQETFFEVNFLKTKCFFFSFQPKQDLSETFFSRIKVRKIHRTILFLLEFGDFDSKK